MGFILHNFFNSFKNFSDEGLVTLENQDDNFPLYLSNTYKSSILEEINIQLLFQPT